MAYSNELINKIESDIESDIDNGIDFYFDCMKILHEEYIEKTKLEPDGTV